MTNFKPSVARIRVADGTSTKSRYSGTAQLQTRLETRKLYSALQLLGLERPLVSTARIAIDFSIHMKRKDFHVTPPQPPPPQEDIIATAIRIIASLEENRLNNLLTTSTRNGFKYRADFSCYIVPLHTVCDIEPNRRRRVNITPWPTGSEHVLGVQLGDAMTR